MSKKQNYLALQALFNNKTLKKTKKKANFEKQIPPKH